MSKTLNARMAQKNDTAANWTSANPILLKGELGIESDTKKIKIGDGVTAWSSLTYANVATLADLGITATAAELNALDGITASVTELNYVDGVTSAIQTQLNAKAASSHAHGNVTNAGAIGSTSGLAVVTGASGVLTTGTVPVASGGTGATTAAGALTNLGITATAAELNALDGITATVTELNYTDGVTSAIQTQIDNKVTKNANITAGTATKITYDAKGLVTGGASLAATDIPTLTLAKISDAGTAASKNTGTASGNVPVLDGTGKLSTSVLPAIAISDTFVVANQTAMLALTAEVGDIAVRTDLNKSFILKTAGASVLANWQELLTPTDSVTSVNSKTGVVTLTTSDIAEGTNQYFTTARANSAFDTKIAATASTALSDGTTICKTTDTFIIDCGNATL